LTINDLAINDLAIDTEAAVSGNDSSAESIANSSPEASSEVNFRASSGASSEVGKLNLASLWQSVSENYIHRVDSLANSLRGLQPGLMDKVAQQHILSEAHALAGSLGSFGFGKATAQCREIESILSSNAYLSAQHTHQLEMLIAQTQQLLEKGLVEKGLVEKGLLEKGLLEKGLLEKELERESVKDELLLAPQLLMVKNRSDSPDESWLQALKTTAAAHPIQVRIVDNIEQAREIIFPAEGANQQPLQPFNIVVLNFDDSPELPDNDSAEFQLLAELKAVQPPIPTIMLTAAASFENRVRVARLGLAGLLQTPVAPVEVLETAMQVLQKSAPPAGKLLIVDDDPDMLILLQAMLQPWGFRLQLLSDPQYFWQTLERFDPDLVLLDVEMPQINGFDLCQVLRNAPRWHETPVLFMSGHTDAETIQQVFSVGADDYIRKPIVAPELIARVLSWLERVRTRQLRADVDSLTGVANRRKSTQVLTRLLGLAQRQGQTLCFALVDFDHFKQINDEYGHPVGDAVLRRFGESLRSTFRSEDVVGRWGGEEFAVGLYGMSRQEGTQRLRQFLEKWQQEVFRGFESSGFEGGGFEGSSFEKGDFEKGGFERGAADFLETFETAQEPTQEPSEKHSENLTFTMTFTAGVAVYPHDGKDLQSLYRAADEALYKAKAAGRNRVCSAT
jgi:diguanylate cyclase (GGDEF)-like protein